MQNTSVQLLFHIRLDPLKLARDPLKVVAGSPMDLLIILADGSPDSDIGDPMKEYFAGTYICISAVKDSMGDRVPLVKMMDLTPWRIRSSML